ncbi:MAG TPA: SIR2 family protein [Mycobacteriales bacterium]|nr:SIR2 family protein [Mycobacteriales bacterium]
MVPERSETAFFNDDTIKRAIVRLASSDSLVIYCGAGVTIDRTGLGWGDLIARLFDSSDERKTARDPTEQDVVALREALPPPALASILMDRMVAHHGSEQAAWQALTPKLQQALYKGSGWQQGALVTNIIRLAFAFIQLSKPVTIVTSNYDTYLEEEYASHRRRLESADGETELAGLVASAAGRSRPFKVVRPGGGAGSLKIVYLHGRVPRAGRAGGPLILSENDYAKHSVRVIGVLEDLFRRTGSGVLILGTSLTDAPLLTALATTRNKTPTDSERTLPARNRTAYRAALLPANSTGLTHHEDKFGKLCQHLKTRTHCFGVDLLIADFHYQIAQLCQEVLTSVGLPDGAAAYASSDAAGYGRRLAHWWETWEAKDLARGTEQTSILLRERLNHIRDYLGAQDGAHDAANEPLKIELWVRYRPGSTSRRLALWATSAGVLWDRTVVRTEELGWRPSIASVKAFIEGRPQYAGLTDLTRRGGPGELRGRWHSFFSVPIRIDLPEGLLPVGVITLASKYEPAKSNIPDGTVRAMDHIVQQLTATGQELLKI